MKYGKEKNVYTYYDIKYEKNASYRYLGRIIHLSNADFMN